MTKKQIESLKQLAIINMQSDFINDSDKMERMREIWKFLETARDLFLINEKQRDKYSKEITAAAMQAHVEYISRKTA